MSAQILIAHDTIRHREASPVTSNPPQSRHFDYAGRAWRLFKRSADPDAHWYFEATLHKERFGPTSLRTNNWALAVTEAKLAIDALRSNRREAIELAMGRRTRQVEQPKYSTFADLFRVIDLLDMQANANTRRNYVWCCKKFFSYTFAVPIEAVSALSLELICPETVEKFVARGVADTIKMKQTDQIRFKRTLRGWFVGVKSIFTPNSALSCTKLGLSIALPHKVDGFRRSNVTRLQGSRGSEFIAPNQAILRETFRQWIKLGAVRRHPVYCVRGGAANARKRHELQPLNATARRNMFIAIGYMLSCGLRKGEVMQLRERHVTRDGHGVPRLVAEMAVKNKSARLEVKPLNPFWHILQTTIERNGWRGEPGDFVLEQRDQVAGHNARSPGLRFKHGGHCDRTYWPFYHVGKWLRDLGWQLQKTNHALRDCGGSLVTMKFGLDRAKIFCRHATRATTESHYSRFVAEDLMDNPNRLAWLSWAKERKRMTAEMKIPPAETAPPPH